MWFDVWLSVLVALRSQPTWPEDPYSYMVDYFGNERSAVWDTMEELREENAAIEEEMPSMQEEIVKMEEQICLAKRKTRLLDVFKAADPEAVVSVFIAVKHMIFLGRFGNESHGS